MAYKKNKQDIYVSFDIEADGPIPGLNSMLSLGAVAFTADGEEISSWEGNFAPLPGASENADTMKWWEGQPEAWEACHTNVRSPEVASMSLFHWATGIEGNRTAVAYPLGFDWPFLQYYMVKYAPHNPFGLSGLDIKSYASAVLKTPFKKTIKKYFPSEWFPDTKHTHVAVEDAREQGLLFINMLKANTQNIND